MKKLVTVQRLEVACRQSQKRDCFVAVAPRNDGILPKTKLLQKLLLFLALTVCLAGCSNDQYAIERQYYRLSKQAGKVFNNPHAVPPRELNRVVKALQNFAKKHPNSNLGLDAEFNIARLYIVKEEYDKARAYLNGMLKEYAKSGAICSEARFLIGSSYEIQDNWNQALEQYKKIVKDYPLTLRGLNMPIYIAQHYKVKFQPDKMVGAYQEAIAHYQALARKYANSPFGMNVENLVAQCYIAIKDWQNAINTFNVMIATYKDKAAMDAIMLEIAFIYQRELKDKIKAKETLQELIKEYPKSKLIKSAQALLKEVNAK